MEEDASVHTPRVVVVSIVVSVVVSVVIVRVVVGYEECTQKNARRDRPTDGSMEREREKIKQNPSSIEMEMEKR